MIKIIVAVACWVFFSSANANDLHIPNWDETTRIGFNTKNSKYPGAVFINSYTQYGPPAGVWNVLDITTLGVPGDAKWVALGGVLIITHGTAQQSCNLTVTTRSFGDTLDAGEYNAQSIEAHVGGGQRSTLFTIVPVRDGKIEWQWRADQPGYSWPTYCAYGINLSLQAYGR